MDRFGFAIVGAGNIAQLHAAAIREIPGARLAAWVSKTRERARALAEKFGGDVCADLDEALRRPDVHAVAICTPSGTHADIGIRAAHAGKHVMVEKPIDVSLTKARALVDACRASGVRLGAIFQSRCLPAVALLKKAILRGRLGRVFVGDAYVKWYRTREYYEAARWRGTKALDGGGALINQAIHTVDLLQHLAGPVAQVFGFAERLRHPYIESEDTAVGVVKFKCGAVGVIEAATSAAPGFGRRIELHGERGTVVLDGNEITVWKLDRPRPEETELDQDLDRLRNTARDASDGSSNPMNLDVAGHRTQLEDLVAAVRDGRPPLVDGAEGLKALEIVLALYRSAETGARVDLLFS